MAYSAVSSHRQTHKSTASKPISIQVVFSKFAWDALDKQKDESAELTELFQRNPGVECEDADRGLSANRPIPPVHGVSIGSDGIIASGMGRSRVE